MALGNFDTEEDAARAVYNEALRRQNADLAGYLMDTHHVYSILPPSAARPPPGAADPGEDRHAPEAHDVDDDAPEGCDDNNLPSEATKHPNTPNTVAPASKRRRVARPHPPANDAPADHRVNDPAQPANPVTPLQLTEPHDQRLPVVVQNCPRKSRSSRTYAQKPTNNATVGTVTTLAMAAPIRRYVDVPISVSTPDLIPTPDHPAVPVCQAVLSPAASLPQPTAMVRPAHPVYPLVQQYSVEARSDIAPGSKHSGFPSVADRRAPAAHEGTGVPGNSQTPNPAAEDSTPKPGNVGVDPKPSAVHPRPPRPHMARAGFRMTAHMPLGATMQPDSSVHQLAAPLEQTQRPPAAPVHQSIAVNTVRRADSVTFQALTVPTWNAHSRDSNDERPQLEVSARPQAVIERNVGIMPALAMSNPPLLYPHEAVVAQPANESLREAVACPAFRASEMQITLPAARRPPINEYSLHQSIANTVRRPSAALQTVIGVRQAQNLNVERPQMETLTRPQPVIGRDMGDINATSVANAQLPSPSHEALPSQSHISLHQTLLPTSTASRAPSSEMPSNSPAPRRRQPIKVKRQPRPLASNCRAGGGSRVQLSVLPPHPRPPAVSTHLEAWASTHVTPPPPAWQPTFSVPFPGQIVALFRPYALQNMPEPVQGAYSSVQQPAPLDRSFDAHGSRGHISSPSWSSDPPAEYNSEWQPVHPEILDIQSSTDQVSGDIHRQGYAVPGQYVVPHVGTISPEMVTAPGNSSFDSEGRRAAQELAAAASSCDGDRPHHDHWFIKFQELQAHNPLYTQAARPTPMRQLVPPPSVEFNWNSGNHPMISPELMMGIPLQPALTSGFQPYGMGRFIHPAEVRPPQFAVMNWDSVEEIHATTTGLALTLIPDQTLTPPDVETPVNLLGHSLPITELQLAAPSITCNTQGADDNVDIATADRTTWLTL